MSDYRNDSPGPAVAIGYGLRTVVLVAAAMLGLAFVFLFTNGGNANAVGGDISAKALTDHECNSSEWHFVITQVDTAAHAPASITVEWANGATEVVPLDKYTGKTAHYVTTSNLDSNVVSATTNIYAAWSGQFNLSHGPCGGTTTPPTSEPPSPSPSS